MLKSLHQNAQSTPSNVITHPKQKTLQISDGSNPLCTVRGNYTRKPGRPTQLWECLGVWWYGGAHTPPRRRRRPVVVSVCVFGWSSLNFPLPMGWHRRRRCRDPLPFSRFTAMFRSRKPTRRRRRRKRTLCGFPFSCRFPPPTSSNGD